MGYLLDTNVVSELRRAQRAHPAVLEWQAPIQADETWLSVITLMELTLGVELKTRKDPRAGSALRDWYENRLKPGFAGRILPVDAAVAERAAVLQAVRTRPGNDALLAATALIHGLTLATRNQRDFAGVPGLAVENPWSTG